VDWQENLPHRSGPVLFRSKCSKLRRRVTSRGMRESASLRQQAGKVQLIQRTLKSQSRRETGSGNAERFYGAIPNREPGPEQETPGRAGPIHAANTTEGDIRDS